MTKAPTVLMCRNLHNKVLEYCICIILGVYRFAAMQLGYLGECKYSSGYFIRVGGFIHKFFSIIVSCFVRSVSKSTAVIAEREGCGNVTCRPLFYIQHKNPMCQTGQFHKDSVRIAVNSADRAPTTLLTAIRGLA